MITCPSKPVVVEESRFYAFGTTIGGSQQGGQNRRQATVNGNVYTAFRIEVPCGCSGCIQTITPWYRWSEPTYGTGTYGSFEVSIRSDAGGVPGQVLASDSRNVQQLIADGEAINNDQATFPDMDMGGTACFEEGDCLWVVTQNTDPDPTANTFSLNGLIMRPRSVLLDGAPTMQDCWRYVESNDGNNWSELSGNFEMMPFFCIELTSGKRWGRPYSVSDRNVWQLNTDTGALGFDDWYINGDNQWRQTYNTDVALTNAEYKFYASQASTSAGPLIVTIDGTPYTVPSSQIGLAGQPSGSGSYIDGTNWPQVCIPIGNLPAGAHTVTFSTTAGSEYLIATTGVLPGMQDCEIGGVQGSAEINTGTGWELMLLWSGVPNSFNRLQGYFWGQV